MPFQSYMYIPSTIKTIYSGYYYNDCAVGLLGTKTVPAKDSIEGKPKGLHEDDLF